MQELEHQNDQKEKCFSIDLDAYMDEAFEEIRERVKNSSASIEVKQQYIDSIWMLAQSIENEWTIDFGINKSKRGTTDEAFKASVEQSTEMLVKLIKRRSDQMNQDN